MRKITETQRLSQGMPQRGFELGLRSSRTCMFQGFILLLSKLNGRDSSLPSFTGVTRFIRRESFASASGTTRESPFSHTSDTSADAIALSRVTLLVPIVPSAVTSLVAIVLSGQLSSTENRKTKRSKPKSSYHHSHCCGSGPSSVLKVLHCMHY